MSSSSDLVSRLKAFLPAIESANIELEQKIKQSGASKFQIDNNLGEEDKEEEVEDKNDDDCIHNNESGERSVQLSFALGDFDEQGKIFEDSDSDDDSDNDKEVNNMESEGNNLKHNLVIPTSIKNNATNSSITTCQKNSGSSYDDVIFKLPNNNTNDNDNTNSISIQNDIGLKESSTRKL